MREDTHKSVDEEWRVCVGMQVSMWVPMCASKVYHNKTYTMY